MLEVAFLILGSVLAMTEYHGQVLVVGGCFAGLTVVQVSFPFLLRVSAPPSLKVTSEMPD